MNDFELDICKYDQSIKCDALTGCKENCIQNVMFRHVLCSFEHGSSIYGTNNENSDIDIVLVVDNRFSDFLSQFPKGIYQNTLGDSKVDNEFVTEEQYINLIKAFDPMAIESLFLPKNKILFGSVDEYKQYFNKDDKWGIRQSFRAISNNSWAKAQKKMTVKKDFNPYVGQKSLFHSMRLLMFATQLCKYGEIKDYGCANDIWQDICSETNQSWEHYKEKYKPLYNKLHSELVLVAPKPV